MARAEGYSPFTVGAIHVWDRLMEPKTLGTAPNSGRAVSIPWVAIWVSATALLLMLATVAKNAAQGLALTLLLGSLLAASFGRGKP